MNKQSLNRLRLFIKQANVDLLHPIDWERFYDFVLAALEEWDSFDHDMVRRLLVEGGFSEEKAIELVVFCERVKDFLDYSRDFLPK